MPMNNSRHASSSTSPFGRGRIALAIRVRGYGLTIGRTPSPRPSPHGRVGLSHMGEGGEKEVVVPSGLEHFMADAGRSWCCLQDVDGELTDDGEVFRGMILAATAGVLVEQNVEDPVQVVLDAP